MSTEQLGFVTEQAARLRAVVWGWASDHASDRGGGGSGEAVGASSGPSAYAPIENIDLAED